MLDDDELDAARKIGLNVLKSLGGQGFAFPCPKLDGTACTIFGHRPRVCSRFMCQVLADKQEGKLSFEEATAHVREARRLLAGLMDALPDYLTLRDTRVMAKNNLATPALQDLLARSQALQAYLDQHFRKPTDGKMLDA